MKKQYVSLLAIILSVSGFLFSCHDKMNKNTGALQFDSIQVNETAHLYNEYTGGAHGMYMSTFLNMDLTLMRPLRLDDIFVGDYQEALTDLIWNQLMADNKVTTHEALEDMGYASTGDITPTENFYLSKEGITFYYNIYDITPYSMGPVKVTIPYAIMEHLLGSNPILGDLKN